MGKFTECSARKSSLSSVFNGSVSDFKEWSKTQNLMNNRAEANVMYVPTPHEHWANTASHAVMIIPSILANEFLIEQARYKFDNAATFSMNNLTCQDTATVSNCTVHIQSHFAPSYSQYEFCSRAYGISLISLFMVSTLFHWISFTQSSWRPKSHAGCSIRRPSLNKLFHVCDRTTIYFFIAGSYTPWLILINLPDKIVWLRWGIWVAAVLGTTYTFMFLEKYKLLDTLLYVAVGLVPGVATYLYTSDDGGSVSGIFELCVGGAFYLSGVVIFKCDGIIPFAHAIWHLFVALGAFTHYYGVYKHFYQSSVQYSVL
ncbi:monocyte to macrophage differentiation factor [Ciona intestinalis]